jgi:hypothetical protein
VLGYSLPEADFLARALFSEAIRSRHSGKKPNNIKMIIIANPDIRIRKSFLELLGPATDAQAQILEFDRIDELSEVLRSGTGS